LWSWGGKEVEADGKTVALNSKETIESVKFAVGLWHDACDEGGLAWDDTKVNRAFLSGGIGATNTVLRSLSRPNVSPTRISPKRASRLERHPAPKGAGRAVQPAGSVHRHDHGLFEEPGSRARLAEWFASPEGYSDAATRMWEKDKVWDADPVLLPFRDIPRLGRRQMGLRRDRQVYV
jgi:multiple sugar transport system substrate-binding protein